MPGPLQDVTVLDLTWLVAGPYCTKLFADYGARVIKVERPRVGDPARYAGPFCGDEPHHEHSALFLHLNTNKRSVTLDLKTGDGVRLAKELARQADLVVESFRPGVMDRLGLGYDVLAQVNPRLVMVSLSSFGQSGPYRDFEAAELTLFAMSGAMIGEGDRDREPLKYAGNQAQYFAGASAASAAISALWAARAQGAGQHVDASIFESLVEIAAIEFGRWTYSGDLPEEIVARRPYYMARGAFPLGIFPCKDGHICFTGRSPRYYRRYAEMMRRPELVDDPRFNTLEAMQLHSDEYLVFLLDWLNDKTMAEAVQIAQAASVPAAPVNTLDTLFTEPQLASRDYFVRTAHPIVGTQTYPGAPFKMPRTPFRPGRAPLLGEHNEQVYMGMLGCSRDDLLRLQSAGAI